MLESSYMMIVHHIGCCWMGEGEFPRYIKWLLVQAMKRRGLTYKDLADLLRGSYGVDYDAKVLGTKVSRGRFSAAFFVQAMLAMGCDGIAFNEPPAKRSKRSTAHEADTSPEPE